MCFFKSTLVFCRSLSNLPLNCHGSMKWGSSVSFQLDLLRGRDSYMYFRRQKIGACVSSFWDHPSGCVVDDTKIIEIHGT